MKVSNAASPPQLEFLTHRSHCPSEMSKRELLRSSSSLWVNKVRHGIQENPKVSKTKRDCVLPGQIWSEGKEEKAFGPCEERVVKGNFYFIVMLFQHNSESPAFLEGKKIEKPNNCWRTEVKQTKYWSTFPEMDFSKLFIWSFELLEGEKAEKSLQLTHSGLLSPVVKRYRIYLTTITHLTSKTWFHQCLIRFFFQNVWLYIWNSIRKWGLRFESNNSSKTDAPRTVLVLPIWTDNQEKVLCSLK